MKILLLLVSIIIASTSNAVSQENVRSKMDAEIKTIIDACWDKSEIHRSSSDFEKMLDGHWITRECIKGEIYKYGVPLFEDKDDFEERFLFPLEKIRKDLGENLYSLYMKNEKCRTRGCGIGTFQKTIIMAELSLFYGEIFEHVYSIHELDLKGR